MITSIEVNGFKCFANECLELKPLSLITGTNSSGKSSLIQAILLAGKHSDTEINNYLTGLGDFDDLKNKYINPREFSFKFSFSKEVQHTYLVSKSENKAAQKTEKLAYPQNITYLSANRVALTEVNSNQLARQEERNFGIYGEQTPIYYEQYKNELVNEELIQTDADSRTLEGQLNYWIKRITNLDYELHTKKITSNNVKASYKNGDGLEFKPSNIGIGINYLFSILVACLSATKNNILIIENPEIHLHPKAQAGIAEFFAFIASKGIQLIIETHNDHLINRVRYEVFKGNIKSSNVVVHYKNYKQPFETIEITSNGKFKDKNSENSFPKGFYDATLEEIFAINTGS